MHIALNSLSAQSVNDFQTDRIIEINSSEEWSMSRTFLACRISASFAHSDV